MALHDWRDGITVSGVANLRPPAPNLAARPSRRGGFVGDFFAGIWLLLRGFGMYARSPRLMLIGLVPALIAFVLLAGGFLALVMWDSRIAVWLTPYADGWASGLRETARAIVEIALLGAWLLLSVLLFTAITLVIGQPFYEAISKSVDDKLGGLPDEINVPFWRTLPRNIVESVRLVVVTASAAAVIFLVELIPVAGQIIGPLLGALLGGWAIVLELTGVPFERRGLRLRHRRQMLRARRSLALGFGVAAFVCFLIPGVDILIMPAAVAGATLLSRRLFGQHDTIAAI